MIRFFRNLLDKAIVAYWEAGQRWSTDRGMLPHTNRGAQDSFYDNTDLEWETVMTKARYAENNSPFVGRIIDNFGQYTVGASGMLIKPSTSSKEFNKAVKRAFKKFCKSPDRASRISMGSFQSLCSRRWFVDGCGYILKTRSKKTKRVKIQFIEAHNLCTPPEQADKEGKTFFRGVETDEEGEPIAYWVRSGETIKRISADLIIPIGEPSRAKQYHYFSFLGSVLNDIQDLHELQGFAKKKAKDAAKISNIFKTNSGELPLSELQRKKRFEVKSETTTGTSIDVARIQAVKSVFGPETVAIKKDEEIAQLRAGTPNEIEQAHWDIIISRICAGCGMSKLLVLPWSMQGTVVRADLDTQNTFFRACWSVLADAFREVYLYFLEDELKVNPQLAALKPEDWDEISICPPRSVLVDIGHQSAAILAEYEAGIITLQEICALFGLDWEEVLEQLAREESTRDEIAAAYKLSPARLRKGVLDVLKHEFEKTKPQAGQEKDSISPTQELKAEMDAYGVAVRAGVVTPTIDDENYFRGRLNLPAITAEARQKWIDDGGVRTPITLKDNPTEAALAKSAGPAPSEDDPNEE